MVNWIMFLAFILIYSQLMFHAIQAQQPPGYKGCYPSSKLQTLHSSRVSRNDGVYCIGFCEASKYRYAATQGLYCKCLVNVPTLNLNESSTRCVNICPGRLSERCGGDDLVSLYDIQEYPKCVKALSGLTALIGDDTNPESKQDDDNSATKCASYCEKLQYKFSGTKGKRCICGEKINEEFKESKCETTCPGNEEETCGGEDSVSLRHTGSQEPPDYPTCVYDPHGIEALKGDGTKRLMHADDENSATRCAIYCKESGYPLSGTKINFCICGKRLKTNITVSPKCEMECPGNKTETCGGDDSVSVRFTGWSAHAYHEQPQSKSPAFSSMTVTAVTQRPTAPATSSYKDITVTTVRQRPTAPATSSYKDMTVTVVTQKPTALATSSYNDTTGSPSKGSQLTAVYILLPTVVISAILVACIVYLVLRRKRLKTCFKRGEVSQEGNMTSGDCHINQAVTLDISHPDSGSTQPKTAGKTCDAEYLTLMHTNASCDAEYLTLMHKNDSAEYHTVVDSDDTSKYVTPEDIIDSDGYLTPENLNYNDGYLRPNTKNYTAEYLTPEDSNYNDGYLRPKDPNNTFE